jgi:TfoX/Sxy family transcriptional regulator of competence genes
MSSKQSTVDFLVEQMAGAGAVSAKKMFGEYGLYCDGKMVGLICDDQLFIKPTAPGKAFAGDLREGCPYPGAKPCLLVPGGKWDDREWLAQLIKISASAQTASKKRR